MQEIKYNKSFPSPYVSNSEKLSEEYAKEVFSAVMDSFEPYREARLKKVKNARDYANGNQSIHPYLKEVNLDENDLKVNVSFQPTKIMQKFEKIIVDDYQQLEEEPKVSARSTHIQDRRERRKSDLKFRMQYRDLIQSLEQEIGYNIEDPNQKVPDDEEELDLITSLTSDEREEVLMNEMLKIVFEDNDIDTKKRVFMSDIFQVNFAGYHYYKDRDGRIRIDYIPQERAIYGVFKNDISGEQPYSGREEFLSIYDIRQMMNLSPKKEAELFKLAMKYRGKYGNGYIADTPFLPMWETAKTRPYDSYTVPVYHIWFKSVKSVGYIDGTDRYGRKVFNIDFAINPSKSGEERGDTKIYGTTFTETSYEGWFAGDSDNPIVLTWGESENQTRTGIEKDKVLCPYIYSMSDNRGNLDSESAVEMSIPELKMMNLARLKIKLTLANHPPAGYAIDPESLVGITLGEEDALSPLKIEDIYRQTGRLYFRRNSVDGDPNMNTPPIIPLDINIQNTIFTYVNTYNDAVNTIRETLGINPNREGTANISRASNQAIQTQIAISQTATYYIYRMFLKATDKLAKQVHIMLKDTLMYGDVNKGYLKYLGEQNKEFIEERKKVSEIIYEVTYDPDISKQDKEYLQSIINSAIASGELSVEDALYINNNIKNTQIAEKYLRFIKKKNLEQAKQDEMERQRFQAEAQGDMGVRVEEAKRETFQIQSSLQAQEWEIKGKNEKDVQALKLASDLITLKVKDKVDISPDMEEFINVVLTNYRIKQEQSLMQTEKEVEENIAQEEQEQAVQELEQAVMSGEISEEEAMGVLQQIQ